MVDKLITRAKKGKESDKRRMLRILPDRKTVRQILDDAKTRFAGRTSGYTRIIKMGQRVGDATEMVQLSFVDTRVETTVIAPKKAVSQKKKTEKVKPDKTKKK